MKNLVTIIAVVLFFGVWLLFIGGILYWSLRRFKRKYDEWLVFGLTHNFISEPRRWTYSNFSAPRGDFTVQLTAQATQVGRSSDPNHLQIDIRLPLANQPEKLAVYRETAVSKLGKLFHTQDIEIGEPGFDAEFKVKGKSPDAVRSHLLDRGRAQSLREHLQGLLEEAVLDEKGLQLHCDARLDRPEEMERIITRVDALAALAAALR